MERKDFLKNGFGFLGMSLIAPSVLSANNAPNACAVTRSETIGPFPTKNPTAFLKQNIIDNRTGVPFTINLFIKNINNTNCGPVWGLNVDIWTCDKDGYYSQYGSSTDPFQQVNMQNEKFLRGRQVTDQDGLVKYTSIFPGWYKGRSTHIHVHIYDKTQSILVTQIAFPEDQNSAVHIVNTTASGYKKGMTGYTYWQNDGEFRDGITDELATVTGSIANGYVLEHTIYVKMPKTTDVDAIPAESQFKLGKNYPNPFVDETTIPVTLLQPSRVKITLLDLTGRVVSVFDKGNLGIGLQQIPLNVSSLNLASGRYICRAEITNLNGTFQQSQMMLKK